MIDGAQLVGGWRLRSWVALGDDGSETFPMGDAPTGLLAYTEGGTMVALMAPADRPPFGSDDLTGGTLTLESPPIRLRGVTRRQRLTWTRVDEAS